MTPTIDLTALTPEQIFFIASAVLPLLVALVTNKVKSPALKASLLIVFSVLASSVANVLEALHGGQSVNLTKVGVDALGAIVVGITAHFGVWKSLGISGALQDFSLTGIFSGASSAIADKLPFTITPKAKPVPASKGWIPEAPATRAPVSFPAAAVEAATPDTTESAPEPAAPSLPLYRPTPAPAPGAPVTPAPPGFTG